MIIKGILLPIILASISLIWIIKLKKELWFVRFLNKIHENERNAVLTFLHKMGESLTSSIELEKSLGMIANFILEQTDAEAGAVFLKTKDEKFLTAKVVLGLFPPLHPAPDHVFTKRKYIVERVKKDKVKIGEGILGLSALTGESQLIKNAINDPRVPKVGADFVTIESLMVTPLRIKDKILGVVAVVNKKNNQRFDEQDMSLLQALADQAALTVDIVKLYDELTEKQRMEQELKVAQDFQKLLLPKECPKVEGFELAAFNHPALEVGGDFYDFIHIDNEHIGVAIADVSGKGIPGALIMAMARSVLRAECVKSLSPKEILRRVNERIFADTQENVFITMTFAILNLKERSINFCRAGHEPIIILNEKKQDLSLYTPAGIALGLIDNDVFDIIEEKVIYFKDNDIVVFYTDGVTEAMDEKSSEYGRERFFETLKTSKVETPTGIIKSIISDIEKFTHGLPQNDDITLVTLKAVPIAAEQKDSEKVLNATG